MKTYLLLIAAAALCCLSTTANAQIPHFGAEVGLNFANVSGTDTPQGAGTRTGLLIGGYMTYNFAGLFAVQPEVLYSMKGTSGSYSGVDYTFDFNYIEIPVLLRFNIPLAAVSPVSVNIYAGPDFAFNVASSLNLSAGGQSSTTDESSQTNSFDFNLAFGGGVGFGIGPTTAGIGLRYTLGTGTLEKGGGDLKNGVFSLIASVGF